MCGNSRRNGEERLLIFLIVIYTGPNKTQNTASRANDYIAIYIYIYMYYAHVKNGLQRKALI